MNDYVEARIDLADTTAVPSEIQTDVMAALLADTGFESFVPDRDGLTAYAPVKAFDEEAARSALDQCGYSYAWQHKTIEGRDWNQEWERNYFQPIVIDDRCVIHSSFHTDIPPCDYDITIDPKMAFGTGHHATTWMMAHRLLGMPLEGKKLLDMGTGTAVLAMIAAMRGASPVIGVEIDEFAAVNARENVALNHLADIRIILGDAAAIKGIKDVDVLLANINRNVILADMQSYVATLRSGATVLLSGFYEDDAPLVLETAGPLGLLPAEDAMITRDKWCCLKLIYRP